MAITFSVIEWTTQPLWDFGWFDYTRFCIEGVWDDQQSCLDVLGDFLQNPIAQRWFCASPDLWGDAPGCHGPFPMENLISDWYRQISHAELKPYVLAILNNPYFYPTPSREQRQPLEAWLDLVQTRGDDVFVLDAPSGPGIRLEWDVFLVFHEFVCFSANREQMIVAVIGFD